MVQGVQTDRADYGRGRGSSRDRADQGTGGTGSTVHIIRGNSSNTGGSNTGGSNSGSVRMVWVAMGSGWSLLLVGGSVYGQCLVAGGCGSRHGQ